MYAIRSYYDMSTSGFKMFSLQHIIALSLVIILYIVILLLYKKYPTEKTKNIIYALISLCLVFCDIAVKIWLLKNGVYKASYDGFLHMCDISGPFLIILVITSYSIHYTKLYESRS